MLGPGFAGYRLTPAQVERIRAASDGATLDIHEDQGAFVAALPGAEIAAGHLRGRALPDIAQLRWFHGWSAGLDNEPVAALWQNGVQVTCSKGNGAIPIAEFTLLAMLMVARRATAWIDAQRRHAWERHVSPELHGATLGLIGLGHIGAAIAARAAAFGMRVVALRRNAGAPPPPHVAAVLPPEQLPALLAAADFVVVAAPLTAETRGLLGEAEFRAMKRSAIYVCVSRGGIADPAALHRALAEGWIAGAALDAHATEPLPPESPFWDMPNVLVTPHNAGTSLGTAERSVDIFCDNLRRYARGEALVNVVDRRSGY
jgi:phosphoglycerate dehydrogenase-like enzyme